MSWPVAGSRRVWTSHLLILLLLPTTSVVVSISLLLFRSTNIMQCCKIISYFPWFPSPWEFHSQASPSSHGLPAPFTTLGIPFHSPDPLPAPPPLPLRPSPPPPPPSALGADLHLYSVQLFKELALQIFTHQNTQTVKCIATCHAKLYSCITHHGWKSSQKSPKTVYTWEILHEQLVHFAIRAVQTVCRRLALVIVFPLAMIAYAARARKTWRMQVLMEVRKNFRGKKTTN